MGLLEGFRTQATTEWHPPPPGACRCESHVDDLLEEHVPLADGSGNMDVADLVASGSLSTVPTPGALWLDGTGPNERRGPFHWRVVHGRVLDPFLDPSAPASLDDVLFVQPGVETVLWLDDRSVLALGASELCMRGVQGAVVRALQNPRLRTVTS